MASNIDPSQPPAIGPTTAAMRANMAAAKSEIEYLQNVSSEVTVIGDLILSGYGEAVTTGTFYHLKMEDILSDPLGIADISPNKWCIKAPPGAKKVRLFAHTNAAQNTLAGICRLHLWRNVQAVPIFTAAGQAFIAKQAAATPPFTEAQLFYPFGLNTFSYTPENHYHVASYLPANTAASYVSMAMVTPWIDIMAEGEEWALYAKHDCGANVNYSAHSSAGAETWLAAEFR
jgi:hypothetical protein